MRRWSGVIARIGVRTTDGRLLLPAEDEAWALQRMPLPVSIMARSLALGDGLMGVKVGEVSTAWFEGSELRASGVLAVQSLPDALADLLVRGEETQAGVDLADCLAEGRNADGLTMGGWVLGGVTIGIDYRSAWEDNPCMIKLLAES